MKILLILTSVLISMTSFANLLIEGGKFLPGTSKPSVVRLRVQKDIGTVSCTGTIISNRVVLTARHCIANEDSSFSTSVNVSEITIYIKEESSSNIEVKEILYTSTFNGIKEKIGTDIAFLILDKKSSKYINFDMIAPISLKEVFNNDKASVVGFGKTGRLWDRFKELFNFGTKVLIEGNILIAEEDEISGTPLLYLVSPEKFGIRDESSEVISNGGSVQPGDSGSGLFNASERVVGVVSGLLNDEAPETIRGFGIVVPLRLQANALLILQLLKRKLIGRVNL